MKKPPIENIGDKFGKLTIKEPYSKTRFFSPQTRAALDLMRPFTLIAPLIVSMSVMVASLVYNHLHFGTPIPQNWYFITAQAGLTIAIVNAASNSLNQAADLEADRISKPYRPIPQGMITVETAQSIAYILYLFALLRAVTINGWFGFFIFLIMLFTVTYSLPPRMKKYLFINQIWIAIPRGFLGIMAAWSVFGDPFSSSVPFVIGAIATTYLIGGMATKDITDAKADKLTGVHTLVNTLGMKKTALITLPFMIFPYLFIPMFINHKLLDTYLWPLTFFVLPSFFIFYLMIKGTESKSLENVQAWAIMYVEYIFFALGFSLITIFSDILPF